MKDVTFIKLALGIAFLLLSLGYLYHPSAILKLNDWSRQNLFDDTKILLARRRIGTLLLLLGILLVYMGLTALELKP